MDKEGRVNMRKGRYGRRDKKSWKDEGIGFNEIFWRD